MSQDLAGAPRLHLADGGAGGMTADARSRALEQAVHCADRPPPRHDTQPWHIELRPDRMMFRVDRMGQLTIVPTGRELVLSVGAALFNARVALAARGWAAEVHRLPRLDDPDLLAEVTAYSGTPEAGLATLESALLRRPTNRRRFTGAQVPDEVLRRLTEIAEREGVLLVPVVHESHRRLVARLTRQADRLRRAEPADRAGLGPSDRGVQRDGAPPDALPHVDGQGGRGDGRRALRDVDTHGALSPDAAQTMVLLATRGDDQSAWLRAGEALQHVLLELIRLDWVADPLPKAIEVPLTRTQLRAALTWDSHPQMIVRIGHAPSTVLPAHRPRADVVVGAPGPSGSVPAPHPSGAGGRPDRPVR